MYMFYRGQSQAGETIGLLPRCKASSSFRNIISALPRRLLLGFKNLIWSAAMSLIGSRKLYGQLVLWSSQILFSLLPAYADDRSAAHTAKEYAQCLQADQTAVDSAATGKWRTVTDQLRDS
jgi:hypothetical protein